MTLFKALISSWTAVSDCNAVRVGTVAVWVAHWPWFCVLTFAGFGPAILDWLSCAIADLTRASSILARVSSSSNFKFSFWRLLILAADCFSSSGVKAGVWSLLALADCLSASGVKLSSRDSTWFNSSLIARVWRLAVGSNSDWKSYKCWGGFFSLVLLLSFIIQRGESQLNQAHVKSLAAFWQF